MKYAVLVNLSFSTPALRANLAQVVKATIARKPTWEAVVISEGTDMEGNPSLGLEVRFDNRADMDDLFALVKNRMNALPILTGSVSIHECHHDEGTPRPCVIEDQFVK